MSANTLSSHVGGLLAILLVAVFICASAGNGASPGRSFRETADILPPSALGIRTDHPLDARMTAFLDRQRTLQGFQDTGLTGKDYLRLISRQVAVFRRCQDPSGIIIDPVQKIEWQYSTPCYALSVALLSATGYSRDSALLESGMKAMDAAVDAMHEYRALGHGEFFIQPVMLALDLYEDFASPERLSSWREKISEIDPYLLYPDNLRRKKACYNHNVVALAGEYLRAKRDLNADNDFLETHLKHQEQYMTPLGMYRDNPGLPMVYDEFSRQFLASVLVEGYRGKTSVFYRDRLWRGAWTSLFMQSPFGECPTGGRSAQHIWNEAQACVTYEIYAAQYARCGKLDEAGAFKRAAHLSLACVKRWIRPDGSGYVVKNRYPMEAQHGYERYSAQSQYNLLACWLMTVAYLYADESVREKPCPADVGGFVVPIVEDFHKVFANAGGTYIEYDTNGYLHYNPTGLIRIHVKGGNPQLGPSDGVVHKFDPKTKEDLGGENLCVGPAWQDASGKWHRLADYNTDSPPKVEVLDETPDRARFRVTYAGDFDGATRITETITVEPSGVTVEDSLEGKDIERMRVYYPMLVFDGLEESKVEMSGSSVALSLRDGAIRFMILDPADAQLKRTGVRLDNRNGEVEAAYADIEGLHARYRIGRP
jgi:hypothetical protein